MSTNHSSYLTSLVNTFSHLSDQTKQAILHEQENFAAIAFLNLDTISDELSSLYSSRPSGRPYHDPISMFRSLVLMAFFNITSFHKWFALLRIRPEYRYFSGFFDKLPLSHASFYDFTARLLDGPYQKPCSHRPAPLSETMTGGDQGRWIRQLDDEKSQRSVPPTDPDSTLLRGYVERSLAALPSACSRTWIDRFNELLLKCAILPSAQRGLLDLSKLTVSADGSSIPSHASGSGKRACSCPTDPEHRRCGCPRFYADPDATWGWDSHRKVFYFGHRLHALSTNAHQTDLLLYASVDGAHKVDSQMAVEDVVHFIRLLRPSVPLFKLYHLVCDMGYDYVDFYRFLDKVDILPIIPLKPSAAKLGADENGTMFNENGTPLCKGRIPMKLHQMHTQIDTTSYMCPAKYLGRTDGKTEMKVDLQRCPLGALCEPNSKMGPFVHIPLGKDLRRFPKIPRDSDLYKKLYKTRTCVERIFSQTKDSGLKWRPYRRKHLLLLFAVSRGIRTHVRLWMKAEEWKKQNTWEGFVEELKKLCKAT